MADTVKLRLVAHDEDRTPYVLDVEGGLRDEANVVRDARAGDLIRVPAERAGADDVAEEPYVSVRVRNRSAWLDGRGFELNTVLDGVSALVYGGARQALEAAGFRPLDG